MDGALCLLLVVNVNATASGLVTLYQLLSFAGATFLFKRCWRKDFVKPTNDYANPNIFQHCLCLQALIKGSNTSVLIV